MKCGHETAEIGIQLCHVAIFSMSAHWHFRIHHNDRVKKVEKVTQWTRTEDTVLMVMCLAEPTREDLSAAGRDCVRAAVRELCSGVSGEHLGDIDYDPRGAPQWTLVGAGAQIFVSISHASHVAVGVASKKPIGLDLERSQRDVSRLLRVLTPEERGLMPRWSAIEIMCAKEAAGKAQRVGLAGSIERWSVSERQGVLMVRDTLMSKSGDGSMWRIKSLERSFGVHEFTCVIASPQDSSAVH